MLTSSYNSVDNTGGIFRWESFSMELLHKLFSRFVIYFMVAVICVGLIYILIWHIKHHIWDKYLTEPQKKREFFLLLLNIGGGGRGGGGSFLL